MCNWWTVSELTAQRDNSWNSPSGEDPNMLSFTCFYYNLLFSNPSKHIYFLKLVSSKLFLKMMINILNPSQFAGIQYFCSFPIWRNSLVSINQNSAGSLWTAGTRVYSLKGNLLTSAFDEWLQVCGSFFNRNCLEVWRASDK